MLSSGLRVFIFGCLLIAPAAAQARRASYGPVVAAYLTGLAEELSELEYHMAQREIAADEYARAKQRLSLLRRFVAARAAQQAEDVVPELQALCADELGALGLGRELNARELKPGAELDGRWKLLSIEPAAPNRRDREPFFIFEELPASRARRPVSVAVPRGVIETIIVRESLPPPKETAVAPAAPPPATPPIAFPPPPAPPSVQPPRILHIYLPEYTDKARQQRIEGELIVRALLQRDGKIKEVKVAQGLGQGLDQRAADAVRRIGFLPARLAGREVDARVAFIFDFKLAKVSVSIRADEARAAAAQRAAGVER